MSCESRPASCIASSFPPSTVTSFWYIASSFFTRVITPVLIFSARSASLLSAIVRVVRAKVSLQIFALLTFSFLFFSFGFFFLYLFLAPECQNVSSTVPVPLLFAVWSGWLYRL
jgi:hypothetical protein